MGYAWSSDYNYYFISLTQDHSRPVQVFVNKSRESTERPVSPVLPHASTPPALCSTPKTSASKKLTSQDQEDELSTCDDALAESLSLQSGVNSESRS